MKYHNTLDGPKVCKASKKECPLGGEHFEGPTAKFVAQKAYETQLEKAYGNLAEKRQKAKQVPFESEGLTWTTVDGKNVIAVAEVSYDDITNINTGPLVEGEVLYDEGSFKFRDLHVEYETTLGNHFTLTRPNDANFKAISIYTGHGEEPTHAVELKDNFMNALDWCDYKLAEGEHHSFNTDWHS